MKKDDFFLKSGRKLSPNRGILGLSVHEDDGALYEGYDATIETQDYPTWCDAEMEQPLTQEERNEIANVMIHRWRNWARFDR